jgi:accessory gene regulator protein AgrB
MAVAVIADLGLFAAGITTYLLSTRAKDRWATWGFWLMVLFVILLAVPAAMPHLSLLPVLAQVALLPLGNRVGQRRSARVMEAA